MLTDLDCQQQVTRWSWQGCRLVSGQDATAWWPVARSIPGGRRAAGSLLRRMLQLLYLLLLQLLLVMMLPGVVAASLLPASLPEDAAGVAATTAVEQASDESERSPEDLPGGLSTPPAEPISAAAPPTSPTAELVDPARIVDALPTVLAFLMLGLAPLLALLTTGFIRISIVLALLRQAFGTNQIPSNHVLTAMSLMLTVLLMMPVGSAMYERVQPALASTDEIPWTEVAQLAQAPIQHFMVEQLKHTESSEEVWLFWKHLGNSQAAPESYETIPFRVVVPAFVVSELKAAFLLGFQVYLPFLVIDLLVAITLLSMGISSLPNQAVSVPIKLMVFVMFDGWQMVVDLLWRSFAA